MDNKIRAFYTEDKIRVYQAYNEEYVKVTDYSTALYESLQYAGMSKMNAAYATTRAIGQQKKIKLEFMFHEYLEKWDKKGVNRNERWKAIN